MAMTRERGTVESGVVAFVSSFFSGFLSGAGFTGRSSTEAAFEVVGVGLEELIAVKKG
jgi:hypothetical protein